MAVERKYLLVVVALGLESESVVTHLDGMSDICSPKSSVALFQQATALDPRTRSLPRASYPGRSVDVRSAWLAVGNSRELGLKRERISGGQT